MEVSNAGVTGRLDSMEKKGWVKRMPGSTTGVASRSRPPVRGSGSGVRRWQLRGSVEDDVATALTKQELTTLNKLLKKMTLHIEAKKAEEAGG
jgi:DNA-binding MarR family transcriptional regulator